MKDETVQTYNGLTPPNGEIVEFSKGKPATVPSHPVIPFIEGDGIGRDITAACRRVLDSAVQSAYGGTRSLQWFEIFAGGKAHDRFGEWLPQDTIDAIARYSIAMKGPLTTPTGGGIRSLTVAMRKALDLYANVRPVNYIQGVPSVLVRPELLDVVIFRENTEDVYAGIEYQAGSDKALRVTELLTELGDPLNHPTETGIGIKIISRPATRRIVRRAIQYAIDEGRKTVTIVHKGNIQKYTEGAFALWGYELAKDEFGDITITEEELWDEYEGVLPDGKILVNDRIADAIFYEVLLNPEQYSVLTMPNLNGDFLSDACAAQIGGLGMAGGINSGDDGAIFEAIHGTAERIADKNVANPTSLILSGIMMLEYLGWTEAAELCTRAIGKTIAQNKMTGEIAKLKTEATAVSTSDYADAIIANMDDSEESGGELVDKPVSRWIVTLGFALFLALGTIGKTLWSNPSTPWTTLLGYGALGFVAGLIAAILFRNNLHVSRKVKASDSD